MNFAPRTSMDPKWGWQWAAQGIMIGGMAMMPAVLRAIKTCNLRIPQDISVVGSTDPQLSQLLVPEVTAIEVYYHAIGAEAARLLRAAAVADNIDAEVEYAIALFNGTGTPRDVPTALSVLTRAARQNSPIAQNRLARILVTGTGAPMDKIEGFKWHLIAKTAGNGDPDLDGQYLEQSPEDRKKSEDRAKKWFGTK